MIHPERYYRFLADRGIRFFTGVPDSLLRPFLCFLEKNAAEREHVITANEGLAIGLAAGYHMSTGRIPLVYLQNSGLGNAVNPLTSLADKDIYRIPMLLLVGWRGRPGIKDEPQHKKMGRITRQLLEVLEIPVYELTGEEDDLERTGQAVRQAEEGQQPVALLAMENIFTPVGEQEPARTYPLSKDEVLACLLEELKGDETVICTTGKIGRSFYELNRASGNKIKKLFLSVGAMGIANHIALGIAMHSREKVFMLDGDGALVMHAGALATIADVLPANMVHLVLNNGCHESVGNQPTAGTAADLGALASAFGYTHVSGIEDKTSLRQWLHAAVRDSGLRLAEVRINAVSVTEPGRPEGNPADWKQTFMKAINRNG